MRRETKFSELLKDMSEGYGSNINNPLLKDPDIIIKNPDFRGHLYQSSDVFQKILKKKFDFSFNEQFYCKDVLRNRMLNELSDEIVPVILFSDDLNSMMYSLENRSPFLDKKLVEFMFSIETKLLIKNGLQKFLLREVSKNYYLLLFLIQKK